MQEKIDRESANTMKPEIIPFSPNEEALMKQYITKTLRNERMRLVRQQVCANILYTKY